MRPLKHILQYDRCEHTTPRKYLCARVHAGWICVCACVHVRVLRGSLIFISKNFFNKKVARFLPPFLSPSLPPTLGITTGSRTGRCISYIRGRRGRARTSYTGPRRIKSFACCSRYFITFLCISKNVQHRARPSRVECARARYSSHSARAHLVHLSLMCALALCSRVFVRVRPPRNVEFAECDTLSHRK